MSLYALALATTLLKGDLPLTERVQKLTPFFQPAPGSTLAFDAAEMRDLAKKVKPAKLRGQITVSPPKGVCFTIQRNPAEPDEYVCKKTSLSFQFADLDKAGQLTWQVSTGDGDFGTKLSWRGPYRVAVVTPFEKTLDDPPEYRFVKSCEGVKHPEKGRRIVVTMVDGESWTIRFPEKDELMPQPDAIPNLHTNMASGQKVSVTDASANKPKEGEHGEAAPAPVAEAPRPKDEDDRAAWSLPRRDTFTMNASFFQPYGSVAGGMKGECRYRYDGPEDDRTTGRLECHDVDGFKQVYIPLTCIAEVRP